MPTERKPLTAPLYERQDGESDVAWEAFRTYRDLGHARSLDAARQKLGNPSDGYTRVLEAWSSDWSWVRRVTEWDRYLDVKRRQASERAVVEMAERQARDAAKLQDAIRPFIEALAEKAGVAVEEMTAGDLAAYLKDLAPAWKSGMDAERKARGMEDLTVKHTGTVLLAGLRHAFSERLKRRDTHPVTWDGRAPAGDDGGGPPEPAPA